MKNQKKFQEFLMNIRNNLVGKSLDLSSNELIDADIILLLEALAANNSIRSLDLNDNDFSSRVVGNLLENQWISELNLSINSIGDDAAKALALNNRLTSLDLCNSNIGNEGAKVLALNKTLSSLDLSFNKITDEGVSALALNNTFISLALANISMGASGAMALARNATFVSLFLYNNNIGNDEAEALALNKTFTTLDFYNNNIGPEGANALARNKTLTVLTLEKNTIGKEAKKAISAMLKRNRENAQCFLNLCRAGKLQLVQSMLRENIVSPYCCERSYYDESSTEPKDTDSLHTALHLAVIEEHHGLARWLIGNYPQLLRMTDNDMKTPLMLENKKGDIAMCAALSGKESSSALSGFFSSQDSAPRMKTTRLSSNILSEGKGKVTP